MTYKEKTTIETVPGGAIYHHNRRQSGNYIAITDTTVIFVTDSTHPNVGGIREVWQFREEYLVENGTKLLVATNSYTINASTPEGKEAAQMVFELLMNTPTEFWN